MSKYVYFTIGGSQLKILKGTVIDFDIWMGVANSSQLEAGTANEISANAQIIVTDTFDLTVDGHITDIDTGQGAFKRMLRQLCVTQIMKHSEPC